MEIYKERTKIFEGVDELAEAVGDTLGPAGNTVGLIDYSGKPYITKDGVTVANSIYFKDAFKNFGSESVKQAAKETVKQAGDGTTTSIVLADALIKKGLELGLPNREANQLLSSLEEEVLQHLVVASREITEDDVRDVAMVSTNGDVAMSSTINRAYALGDIVHVEEGSDEDVLLQFQGMRMPGSYLDRAFINNVKKQAVDYKDVKFIAVEGKVNDFLDIGKVLGDAETKPVIIMTEHMGSSALNILKREYNNGNIVVGLIKTPGFAGHRKDLFSDIVTYCGLKKFKEGLYVGELEAVFADAEHITLTKEGSDVAQLVAELKEAAKAEKDYSRKSLLEKRVTYLSANLSVIYVGGKSDIERGERKDRMDDAVLAVKSAFELGVVPGGGRTLYYIAEGSDNPFAKALSVIYHKIIETTKSGNIPGNILDPFKVVQCAVQNSISVTKTLLSTHYVVNSPNLWK